MIPAWYGSRYPKYEDLVRTMEEMGALGGKAAIGDEAMFFPADPSRNEPPVILIPSDAGPLRQIWLLAHEIGHLMQHGGYTPARSKQECQANRWAACALIPQARIEAHGNASLDAFIGALSSHYEDIPLEDCATRRLAAKISQIRLGLLRSKLEAAV